MTNGQNDSARSSKWDIVVVTYNSSEDLKKNWSTPFPDNVKIIVVDNDSSDDTVEVARAMGLVCVQSPNHGLAKSNNIGANLGEAEFVLFANPDISLTVECLASLEKSLTRNPRSIVAPRLVNDDGVTWQANARAWPTIPRVLTSRLRPNSRRAKAYQWPDGDPDWFTGACIAMTRSDFEERLHWPEDYFLYYEDVQLCIDARRAGLKVLLCEDAIAGHGWRRDSTSLASPATRRHLRSAVKFYSKNPRLAIGVFGDGVSGR
ncbi:glycosyltransferase [Gordonia alkanivorans]|uniref:glycosyltransferase n=1 Tax=Gordonia alkanivorans TaxID=84096 RepID=UPI0018CB0AA6|nr:glycosyltransferase family 2 protein [Gordonia alkanivorans]